MEYRNSIESAFGRIKYDLYDKKNELERIMAIKNWRTDTFYEYLERN